MTENKNIFRSKSTRVGLKICLKLTLVFGVVVVLVKQQFTAKGIGIIFLFSAMYSFGLGLGNGLLNEYLDSKWSWVKETQKRLVAGIFSTILYTTIIVLLIHYILYIVLFIIFILVALILLSFIFGKDYFKHLFEGKNGKINKNIVAQLQSLACNAIGLTGADAGLIKAYKREVKMIDFGFVGDVDEVDGELLIKFLDMGLTPVFAPLTFSQEHGMLNTNADTQASEIARALAKSKDVSLTYCFEKKGVLRDINDDESVISSINPEEYQALKAEKVIFEGMIPKLDNAFEAIQNGVKKVIICQ